MKAIFLDIDGVLATLTSARLNWLLHRPADKQWYDSVSLFYLGRLVRETGAKVVLSSTWRTAFDLGDPFSTAVMEDLLLQLERAGAPVFSSTPVVAWGDRSDEIASWLDEHPCESYVILDDLAVFENRPDVCDGHLVLIEDSDGIKGPHFYRARAILCPSGD